MCDLTELRTRLRQAQDQGQAAKAVIMSEETWKRLRRAHVAETGAAAPTVRDILGVPVRFSPHRTGCSLVFG